MISVTLQKEKKRLLGMTVKSAPQEVLAVNVMCEASAFAVLERFKSLFVTLVAFNEVFRGKTDDFLIDDPEEALREWFVEELNSLLETELQEEDIEGLEWITYFGDGRDWLYWDSRLTSENELEIYLEVTGFPISGFSALRWLLMTVGANSVEQGEWIEVET